MVCLQQIVEVAECIGFGGQLLLLWLVELEVYGFAYAQHSIGICLRFLGRVPESKESQTLSVAQHYKQSWNPWGIQILQFLCGLD